MGKSMKNMVGVSVLKGKIRQSWCGGGQGKYSGGVLEYFYLRSCKTEFSMICFMEKGKNIWYTYKTWCIEAVKGQINCGVGRFYQEEVRGIQEIVQSSCCSRYTMRVFPYVVAWSMWNGLRASWWGCNISIVFIRGRMEKAEIEYMDFGEAIKKVECGRFGGGGRAYIFREAIEKWSKWRVLGDQMIYGSELVRCCEENQECARHYF